MILLAGVNGAGKTTTIGKLTRRFQSEKRSVLLAAGDTYRAAAREQLAEWGRRHDVIVVFGSSSSSLAGVSKRDMPVFGDRVARLVGHVPSAKRLADELEVLDAVRAVTTVNVMMRLSRMVSPGRDQIVPKR